MDVSCRRNTNAIQGQLARSFEQPELKRPDIWYIDPGEKYLGWSMTDVAGLIGNRALRGFGRNPCPARHYFAGYLAVRNERFDLAHEHLNAALESKCFDTVKDRLALDVLRAKPMQPERR